MQGFNIKVGDYVETWDGDIGYVTDYYFSNMENCPKGYVIVYKITHSDSNRYIGAERRVMDNCIKRIGTNVFSEKKNNFKPIKPIEYCFTQVNDFYAKLNELIDHINAIQERLNEDGLEKERH